MLGSVQTCELAVQRMTGSHTGSVIILGSVRTGEV